MARSARVNPTQNTMQSTLQVNLTGDIIMAFQTTFALAGDKWLVAIFTLLFNLSMRTGTRQYQAACILRG
ncbi:MAG: hypothetical protein BGO78_09215 [Chloroflexi bacterium 44-23]|nr:MAG: hypothetical protein BGO78_09215 [Chloroflexi bacterium 44-23]